MTTSVDMYVIPFKKAKKIKKKKNLVKEKEKSAWAVVFVQIFLHFCGEAKGDE